MAQRSTIVFDVGKTNAKLSLWTPEGQLQGRLLRANPLIQNGTYRALPVEDLEEWLASGLAELARRAPVGAIVPVAHGAAAALVAGDHLFAAPLDYEQEIEPAERTDYCAQRDDFGATGSPALPQGLNLGLQLHYLERLTGPWPDNLRIVPWPQYWAWRLSGVLASEVTSLGCHTDLWRPLERRYSELAQRRGWAQRMTPLRRADEALGTLTSAWVARTGLPADCVVHCGLHDSNAALLGARGHAEIAEYEATVLSTGTWFVAMRTPGRGADIDASALSETRDCLINVDTRSEPIPSARFMGGREAELIGGFDRDLTHPDSLIERLPALLKQGVAALPTFAPGVGPFPQAEGRWFNAPQEPLDRRAVAGLYLALMADGALELIGSRERLLIEGRFAEETSFVRALAALRPHQQVFTSSAHDNISYGALRLLQPALAPAEALHVVTPLDIDFSAYARQWREHAARSLA